MDLRGAYAADRAAALSGVPRSTIHYWARNEILVPSVSATRTRLWSYADLMALRAISWLRRRKSVPRGAEVPGVSMREVRRALEALGRLDLSAWSPDSGYRVAVEPSGGVVLLPDTGPEAIQGQGMLEVLDVIRPFEGEDGLRGPDLCAPRPLLRIIPGKLGGEPHVTDTRVETRAIASLADRGMDYARIRHFYPDLAEEQIAQAVDLERQLSGNLLGLAA